MADPTTGPELDLFIAVEFRPGRIIEVRTDGRFDAGSKGGVDYEAGREGGIGHEGGNEGGIGHEGGNEGGIGHEGGNEGGIGHEGGNEGGIGHAEGSIGHGILEDTPASRSSGSFQLPAIDGCLETLIGAREQRIGTHRR